MRYLKSREDFLLKKPEIEKIDIPNQIKSSQMISEAFENDIRWGDSLVGRLINSTIRLMKIGYNQTKIPKIVESLECELNRLVSEAMTRDLSAQYNYLYIRSILSEIQSICLSTQDDISKLRLLLGWDGDEQNPMWDGADPEADLPNRVEGGRIVTDQHGGGTSIMQNIIDRVTEKLPNLERYIGIGREELLDALSNFTIELRKLTVGVEDRGSVSTPLPNFSVNFGNILNVLNSVNESRLTNYWNFIDNFNEAKIGDTKKEINKVESKIQNTTDPKEKERLQKHLDILKNRLNKTKTPSTLVGNNTQNQNQKTDLNQKADDDKDQQNIKKPVETTDTKTAETPTEGTDKNNQTSQEGSIKKIKEYASALLKEIENKDEDEIKKLPNFLNLKKEVSSLKEESINKIREKKVKVDENTINLYDALCNYLGISTTNHEQKTNDSYSLFDKFLILEGSGNTPGGTPSVTPSGTSNPSSSSTPVSHTVKELYESYWKNEIDKGQIKPLTQREIEQFETLLQEGREQLVIDITKRPDPVIAIVRICRRAHKLYFQSVIPSGRKDGMVSNKTFREYIYIGDGAAPDPARLAGNGPWLIKSIWEAWEDGVTKILENQELRKVLANVKFVVAGAEDSFNMGATKESVSYLKEATGDTDEINKRNKLSEKAPHGEIIFNFLQDMIDQENQAKFDKSRKKLMKQYFGIVDPKEEQVAVPERTPNKEDVEQNVFLWESFSKTKFVEEDLNKLFAYPIKDNRRDKGNATETKEMVFMQPIKLIDSKGKVLIKFTFNSQLQAEEFRKISFRNYTIQDYNTTAQSRPSKYIYFGLMLNDKLDKGLKLCYANVTDNTPQDIYSEPNPTNNEFNFIIEKGSIKTKQHPEGSKIKFSKLIRYDQNRKKYDDIKKKDLKIKNEKSDSELETIQYDNGNLIDKLKEKGTTYGFW